MIINKVTMHIMINLIQMLPIFVFEIRPRDCLRNESGAMTVFIIISLFPRDQWLELFIVGGFPTMYKQLIYVHKRNGSFYSHKQQATHLRPEKERVVL
jgi:hypothetical protein